MLFRANANNNDELADQDLLGARQEQMRNSRDAIEKHDAVDPRAEEDGDRQQQPDANTMPRLNGVGSRSASLSLPTSAQSSSKFHSLKRKLFPNRMRTALPARIPPLVTSPISVSTLAAEAELDAALRSNCSNQHTPVAPEHQSAYTRLLKPHREEIAGSTATITNEDDDDDLELEIAIENLDTGTEQDTLNEVGPACFAAIAVATSLVSLVTIC